MRPNFSNLYFYGLAVAFGASRSTSVFRKNSKLARKRCRKVKNLHEKSAKTREICTKLVQLWLKPAPKRCKTGDV